MSLPFPALTPSPQEGAGLEQEELGWALDGAGSRAQVLLGNPPEPWAVSICRLLPVLGVSKRVHILQWHYRFQRAPLLVPLILNLVFLVLDPTSAVPRM